MDRLGPSLEQQDVTGSAARGFREGLSMEVGFTDPRIRAVFAAYPRRLRTALLAVREIVLAAAAETAGVGPLVETLKWGQPAYYPARPRTGTTVRIDAFDGSDCYAVFFHCRTDLVSTFRTLYPGEFAFHGNRALVFSAGADVPTGPLKHCVALALTYHLARNRSPASSKPSR
jgi:hypothetical protein